MHTQGSMQRMKGLSSGSRQQMSVRATVQAAPTAQKMPRERSSWRRRTSQQPSPSSTEELSSQQPAQWYRLVLASLSAACCLQGPAFASGAMPLLPGKAPLTPYEEARNVALGPTADGYIRACQGNINANCVSTASTNDAYGPAWRCPESTPQQAAEVLEQAVAAALPDAELVRAQQLSSGAEYRAFTVDGLFGPDYIEFLIKPDGVTNRNWDGDKQGGLLVTYRSLAGSVKYLWPIQQPLSDFDRQRKRLAIVKSELGWSSIGCELLECYADS